MRGGQVRLLPSTPSRNASSPPAAGEPRARRLLEGRVLDEQERPVGGARVAALTPEQALRPPGREHAVVEPAGRSGPSGRFGPIEVPAGLLLVRVEAGGFARYDAAIGDAVSWIDVRLHSAVAVVVEVLDSESGRIDGAHVDFRAGPHRAQGRTGARGEVRLDLPLGQTGALSAYAPGYTPCVQKRIRIEREARRLTCVLSAAREIEGRVLDAKSDAPIAGARIVTVLMTWRVAAFAEASSDSAGRFRLMGPGSPAETPALLRVSHESYCPLLVPVPVVGAAGPSDSMEIRLAKGLTVSGQVVDERGDPVAGAVVTQGVPVPRDRDGVLRDGLGNAVRRAVTDLEGRFRTQVDRFPTGTTVIELLAYEPAHGYGFVRRPDNAESEELPEPIRLAGQGGIAGFVKNSAGRPLGGSKIRFTLVHGAGVLEDEPTLAGATHAAIRGLGGTNHRALYAVAAVDGSFWCERLPSGAYWLEVARTGGWWRYPVPMVVHAGQTTTVEVELEQEAGLEGRVMGTRGRAISDAVVLAIPRAGSGSSHASRITRTNRFGGFALPDVSVAVRWDLRVEAPGWAPTVVSDVAAGEGAVQVALQRAGLVTGTLELEGRPATIPIEFALVPADKDSQARRLPWVQHPEDGSFRLDPVPTGRYWLIARTSDRRLVTSLELVQVSAGAAVGPLKLTLRPSCLVAGTIRRSKDGSAVQGAEVLLDPAHGNEAHVYPLQRTRTDAAGRFRLEGLPPGAYELRFQARIIATLREPISLQPGQEFTRDWTVSSR